MPSLPKQISMLFHNPANPCQFPPMKTHGSGKPYRLKPELRVTSRLLHVDVRRLIPLATEEKEPITVDTMYRRHR